MFDDFERYARVPEEYAAPEAKQYTPTVREGGGCCSHVLYCVVGQGALGWVGGVQLQLVAAGQAKGVSLVRCGHRTHCVRE